MDAATPQGLTLWRRLVRLARHRWTEGRLRSAFPPDLLERLTRRDDHAIDIRLDRLRHAAQGFFGGSVDEREALRRRRGGPLASDVEGAMVN